MRETIIADTILCTIQPPCPGGIVVYIIHIPYDYIITVLRQKIILIENLRLNTCKQIQLNSAFRKSDYCSTKIIKFLAYYKNGYIASAYTHYFFQMIYLVIHGLPACTLTIITHLTELVSFVCATSNIMILNY